MSQPEDTKSIPHYHLVVKGKAADVFSTLQAMAEASEKAKCQFVSCMVLAHALAGIPLNPDKIEINRRNN